VWIGGPVLFPCLQPDGGSYDTIRIFSTPVTDDIAPDYSNTIKYPMDFSTVDAKMRTGRYGAIDDLLADVGLMCDNCVQYNGGEGDFGKHAKAVKKKSISAARRTKTSLQKWLDKQKSGGGGGQASTGAVKRKRGPNKPKANKKGPGVDLLQADEMDSDGASITGMPDETHQSLSSIQPMVNVYSNPTARPGIITVQARMPNVPTQQDLVNLERVRKVATEAQARVKTGSKMLLLDARYAYGSEVALEVLHGEGSAPIHMDASMADGEGSRLTGTTNSTKHVMDCKLPQEILDIIAKIRTRAHLQKAAAAPYSQTSSSAQECNDFDADYGDETVKVYCDSMERFIQSTSNSSAATIVAARILRVTCGQLTDEPEAAPHEGSKLVLVDDPYKDGAVIPKGNELQSKLDRNAAYLMELHSRLVQRVHNGGGEARPGGKKVAQKPSDEDMALAKELILNIKQLFKHKQPEKKRAPPAGAGVVPAVGGAAVGGAAVGAPATGGGGAKAPAGVVPTPGGDGGGAGAADKGAAGAPPAETLGPNGGLGEAPQVGAAVAVPTVVNAAPAVVNAAPPPAAAVAAPDGNQSAAMAAQSATMAAIVAAAVGSATTHLATPATVGENTAPTQTAAPTDTAFPTQPGIPPRLPTPVVPPRLDRLDR
jgi:hypothetical protein